MCCGRPMIMSPARVSAFDLISLLEDDGDVHQVWVLAYRSRKSNKSNQKQLRAHAWDLRTNMLATEKWAQVNIVPRDLEANHARTHSE